MNKKIRVVYISNESLDFTFSGTAKLIKEGFLKRNMEVIELVEPIPKIGWVNILKSLIFRLFRSVYIYKRDNYVINKLLKRINSKLKNIEYDIVFSHYEWLLCYLNTEKPIFCWPDNFFTDFVNFYSQPWSTLSINNGIAQSKSYYKKASATFFSSEWALNTAKKTEWTRGDLYFIPYGIGTSKVDNTPNKLILETDYLHLLWIGLDPIRKGLKKSIEIVNQLNSKGMKSRLHVIGLDAFLENPFTIYHGRLMKSNSIQLKQFQDILTQSDFLLFPTEADCTPMVIGEALSNGVPVISHNVGGIPSVMDSSCGKLFELSSEPFEISNWILKTAKDPQRLSEMKVNAKKFAQENLSWEKSIDQVVRIISNKLTTSH